jgi:alpha-galactosidase
MRRPSRTSTSPPATGPKQTIGDTLGVGGIFRALRTIPVMLGIGEDLAAVAPDAWLSLDAIDAIVEGLLDAHAGTLPAGL